MKNRVIVAIVWTIIVTPCGVGDAKDKHDVVEKAPENQQQSSHFNIHIFLKMQDPRQAAVLMLEDARKHGVDIDAIPQRDVTPGRIRLPYATIEPTEGDRSFVEAIPRSESKSEVSDELMCVVQFSRFCSVRETAGILSLGVRLFRPLHTHGRIAKIPADQLETLLTLPYVKWIGPYLPSYKYNASYNYDYDWYFSVSAFIEDEDIIRADLMAIGVEISMRRGRYTTIKMTDEKLVELASIWWVEKIHQSPRTRNFHDSGTESKKSEKKYKFSKYIEMDDPKEAAKLMIEDAQADSIDINRRSQRWFPPTPIAFRSGSQQPKINNQELLQQLSKGDIPTAVGGTDAVCVFQIRRMMSIREWSRILSAGVKIYGALTGHGRIARIPVDQIEFIASQPAIGWCDFYRPEYKYRHDLQGGERISFNVVSLCGRSDDFESDLVNIGIKINNSWPGVYNVIMSTDDVGKVAELWWVREISPVTYDEYEKRSGNDNVGPVGR